MSESIEGGESAEQEIVEIMSKIKALKKTLSRKYMANMNSEFVKDVRTLNFTVPKRLDGKPSSRVSSHSTTGSADLESTENARGKTETVSTHVTKLVNQTTEYLLKFEERCFIGRVISDSQVRCLRSLNRGILVKVVEKSKLFKHQRSLPIAITILMFNSSKMRIPRETFRDLLEELFPRALGSSKSNPIPLIKQSKTYELLKSIIRVPASS